jgi:hypothetical protein
MKELEVAVQDMKAGSAPSPNGFNITFFKKTMAPDQGGNMVHGGRFQQKLFGPKEIKLWSDNPSA